MNVRVINDLQWGSCAKRLFTEAYVKMWNPNIIITNGMPNSGGYDSKGVKWSALPIGASCIHMISPGAVINIDDLRKEMKNLPQDAIVLMHENTGIITQEAIDADAKNIRIGSTMTGGTEVSKAKMDRDPDAKVLAKHFKEELPCAIINTTAWLYLLKTKDRILLLCAQGHGLSVNWGMYPYTTSRNTSPAQAIADAGIPPQAVTKIIGCMRTAPIRVSNRYSDEGELIGYSGPCYDDHSEISWEIVGVPQEITSVSKKVRRVFSYSRTQIEEAVAITGTTDIFLGFINYIPAEHQQEFVEDLQKICNVSYIGYGKTIDDIVPSDLYKFDKSWVS